MEDSTEEHRRDVSQYGGYNNKIHYLRLEVYTREKGWLIKREFSVFVLHPKEGDIVWTCVKDNTIEEKQQYKYIGLRGFDYKLYEEEVGGELKEILEGCTYLNHIIKLWTVYWFKKM